MGLFKWWLSAFQKGELGAWVEHSQAHFLGFLLTKAKPVANPDSSDYKVSTIDVRAAKSIGVTIGRGRKLWIFFNVKYFHCKWVN